MMVKEEGGHDLIDVPEMISFGSSGERNAVDSNKLEASGSNPDLIKIYHGTLTPFNEIDVTQGQPYKDFGRGFYCAREYEQAKGLVENRKKGRVRAFIEGLVPNPANLSVDEYSAAISLYVYTYTYDQRIVQELQDSKFLSTKIFKGVDIEWFDFIVFNRETEPTVHNYDIVIGPTADDDTTLVIRRYLAGKLGDLGTEKSKEKAIKALRAEKLGIQLYFKSDSAIKVLSRVKEEVFV